VEEFEVAAGVQSTNMSYGDYRRQAEEAKKD